MPQRSHLRHIILQRHGPISASHHDSSDPWEDNERQLTRENRRSTNILSYEDVGRLGDHTHVGERTHVIIGRDHITSRT